MNDIFSVANLFIVMLVVWVFMALGFWAWWTKVFRRPFFSYDMLILMVGIGLTLTRVAGFIAANISDNLAIAQIDFSRITQVADLQFNYLIIPLIPLLAYQFWVMSIELSKGWQKRSLRLFQFGLLLSLPVLVLQVVRAGTMDNNSVLGYFIALVVWNLVLWGLLELYQRRQLTWLRSGTSAILGWCAVSIILIFGFQPYAPGELIINLIAQVALTVIVLLPYFDKRQRLPVEVTIPEQRLN